MASVKYGGGILQMSGSIGGNTFARNRFGNYVRARTVPTNPKTARQVKARAAVAFLADRWAATLTAVQRTAWNLYGASVNVKNRLGEDVQLTGFNHYIRSNAPLKVFAFAVVDAGPVVFELPAQDPTFAIAASEATQQITATYDDTMDWATETGGRLLLFGGTPQNPQRNFFGGPWRSYGHVAGVDAAPPAGPHAGVSPFAVAELQRLWAYARILRKDGRMSQTFEANCFVGA